MHWMDARALRRKDAFRGERPLTETVLLGKRFYIPYVLTSVLSVIEEYLGLEGGPPFSCKSDQNSNTPRFTGKERTMGTNLQGYHLLWPDLPTFSQLQFTALTSKKELHSVRKGALEADAPRVCVDGYDQKREGIPNSLEGLVDPLLLCGGSLTRQPRPIRQRKKVRSSSESSKAYDESSAQGLWESNQSVVLLGKAVKCPTLDGDSPVAESITSLRSDPSSMGHVESRVNQQGPPCKAKYSWVTDSEVVP
ncbi:hypothetical protein V6N13_019722 [Hibiscus sabdariffa]